MNIMEDVLIYDETGKEVTGVKDCSVATIVIPDGVTSIGEYAFEFCSSVASIVISDSVTTICDVAFAGCRSLTSIDIPNGVASIGYGAFYYRIFEGNAMRLFPCDSRKEIYGLRTDCRQFPRWCI